ncbi:hypothetical protein Tco_1372868 [Tanacetum coccineum]
MEGPWRDARLNSLFSSHEQNPRFVVLHVNPGSARSVVHAPPVGDGQEFPPWGGFLVEFVWGSLNAAY